VTFRVMLLKMALKRQKNLSAEVDRQIITALLPTNLRISGVSIAEGEVFDRQCFSSYLERCSRESERNRAAMYC